MSLERIAICTAQAETVDTIPTVTGESTHGDRFFPVPCASMHSCPRATSPRTEDPDDGTKDEDVVQLHTRAFPHLKS